MVQSGHSLKLTNRRYESYESLKKNISGYNTINEFVREFAQTCTNATVDVENPSGENIHDIEDANKVLEVWQKSDQKATDGTCTGIVEWQSSTGVVTSATWTFGGVGVNTTTHVALVAAVTTARFLRSFVCTNILCADEIVIGNAAGTEIFGVIPVGYHQCLKSGFRARYISATVECRSFLAKIKCHLNIVTAVVTIVITFTPKGYTLSTTKTFTTNSIEKSWEPCLEVAEGSDIHITIIDDNAAHPVATLELTYVEAYNS
jgi:hypothetical protein